MMYLMKPKTPNETQLNELNATANAMWGHARELIKLCTHSEDPTPTFVIARQERIEAFGMQVSAEKKHAFMEMMRDKIDEYGQDVRFAAFLTAIYIHQQNDQDEFDGTKVEGLMVHIETAEGCAAIVTSAINRHPDQHPTLNQPAVEILYDGSELRGGMVGYFRKHCEKEHVQ